MGANDELAVVPGAGYASNVDSPEAFTLKIRKFARRAIAGPPDPIHDGAA